MQTPHSKIKVLILFLIVSISHSIAVAQNKSWRDVSTPELQQSAPKVEPDADAEALFWEVRVDDSSPEELVLKHYVRVKIFTERGRERFSKFDIPYVMGTKIKDLMARVVKPDGSVVEVAKTDIFDREVIKVDKGKIKSKSFAVPGIGPGVIVEYQYKEVKPGYSANRMRMVFQRDIPIQRSTYWFSPYEAGRYLKFNMPTTNFVKDKDGFYKMSLENVPAIKEEPRMPPEDEVRAWAFFYYDDNTDVDISKFWNYAGYYIVKAYDIKDTLKPGKDLKAAVGQITAGATEPNDQLAKIFEFCKTKVKNIDFDPSIPDEEKEKIKPNKSTWDTYQKLQGRSREINELFASMASALGLETRIAFGGDRSELFFNTRTAHWSFVHFSSIAVNVGGRWRYFDPGSLFSKFGMLPWFEEDTTVLLLGPKDFITTETPLSGPQNSATNRTGRFKLLEDGTLEGTVKIEYTGQESYVFKLNRYDDSPAKREEDMKEGVKARMSSAEVSEIKIENVTDPEKPVVVQYKLRVPNYAQKTGKRMFFQPGVFEYGAQPEFSSATRKYQIYFRYPWSENDDVEIELPKGFKLDNADQPGDIADPSRIGSLSVNIGISTDGNLMKYTRKFYFGDKQQILFPAEVYQPLKNLFDAFNKVDSHTITLRQP